MLEIKIKIKFIYVNADPILIEIYIRKYLTDLIVYTPQCVQLL